MLGDIGIVVAMLYHCATTQILDQNCQGRYKKTTSDLYCVQCYTVAMNTSGTDHGGSIIESIYFEMTYQLFR